ncbi:MAG: glycerol-3-phosphate dehydrogenase/oxidase [Proteobacteria bacterium]|nr:glycerol-3-phosphate dehydrogenase/oxidase [Pseudomonadota bacterium]
MSGAWTALQRTEALGRAAEGGLDVLVIGGGITGAGVLRDAASRGLRACLVERDDFASGTSSRSSKLVHGGLRYIGEGQLRVTREACRERDWLVRNHPNLVQRLPFVFPAYHGSRVPLWQLRAALAVYAALANFRRTARFRTLTASETLARMPLLRSDGLAGAGLYADGQVDDVRLVLETLKSARRLGAEAVNHAEVVGLLHRPGGGVDGARVHDVQTGRLYDLRAHAVVNAAGAAVERVLALERRVETPELRPAKGVHLVVPSGRLTADAAVVFEARDGRHVFLIPWDEVTLIGTTDEFSDEPDAPVVHIEEVHYLLDAVNAAFPHAALTTNDLRSVFAGVRPLVAAPDAATPSTSVSRDDRVTRDAPGLVSVVGGKLTTHRAMAQRVVDRVLAELPGDRRSEAGPSRTAALPLRDESFDRDAFVNELVARFGVDAWRAELLIRAHGAAAEDLLARAKPEWRRPIGTSRYLWAEIVYALENECALSLCDLFERRLRLAIFAEGQGLAELDALSRFAAEQAGWSEARRGEEARAYSDAVRGRYQIAAPRTRGTGTAAAA